jgi:hypothetical protein
LGIDWGVREDLPLINKKEASKEERCLFTSSSSGMCITPLPGKQWLDRMRLLTWEIIILLIGFGKQDAKTAK